MPEGIACGTNFRMGRGCAHRIEVLSQATEVALRDLPGVPRQTESVLSGQKGDSMRRPLYPITVGITQDTEKALVIMANTHGKSVSAFVRELLEELTETDKK